MYICSMTERDAQLSCKVLIRYKKLHVSAKVCFVVSAVLSIASLCAVIAGTFLYSPNHKEASPLIGGGGAIFLVSAAFVIGSCFVFRKIQSIQELPHESNQNIEKEVKVKVPYEMNPNLELWSPPRRELLSQGPDYEMIVRNFVNRIGCHEVSKQNTLDLLRRGYGVEEAEIFLKD